MNKAAWRTRLLGFGGVLETLTGLALLVDPAGGTMLFFGSSVDGAGMAIGRIGGAGLLALGIACWLARRTPASPASVGVAWAYVVYNVVTCVTLVWASMTIVGASLPALGGAILHGVIGVMMLGALLGRSEASA
jgi:hypothetical protein